MPWEREKFKWIKSDKSRLLLVTRIQRCQLTLRSHCYRPKENQLETLKWISRLLSKMTDFAFAYLMQVAPSDNCQWSTSSCNYSCRSTSTCCHVKSFHRNPMWVFWPFESLVKRAMKLSANVTVPCWVCIIFSQDDSGSAICVVSPDYLQIWLEIFQLQKSTTWFSLKNFTEISTKISLKNFPPKSPF